MNKEKLTWSTVVLTLFITVCGFAQNVTLNGVIYEASTGETVLGANILFPDLGSGVVSNEYGFYSVELPNGRHRVVVSYLGFKSIERDIDLDTDLKLDFRLEESASQLEEVVVTQDIEKLNIAKPQMSVNTLSAKTVKSIPTVLGEPDLVRSLVLLPGVSNAGEAASGFNVRGGGADQNLILLDEAIIFNSSHLFGFFSVFNNDAIKSLKLYKAGIPARYGGRLSSVLDIYQREGNNQQFKLSGGVGLLASKLLLEGPIQKDKASFLVAGRTSYAHLFLKAMGEENTASFYDLNTKVSYRLNDSNTLYLSGYFGRDNLSFGDDFVNNYGNALGNLRWNHIFSDRLFSNMSLIYSDYNYNLDFELGGFEWSSNISNFNFKYDFLHFLNNDLKFKYGVNNIYYRFQPGRITPSTSESGINPIEFVKKYANELALYFDVEQKITDKLNLSYGLRWSSFNRLGQTALNLYDENGPLRFNSTFQIYQAADPIGTESFGRRETIAHFHNFEQRLALSYAFDNSKSVKMSYNRMTQYLHLLSNTNSPTPLDIWAPSGKFIKPQLLDQYAVGFYKDFFEAEYSLQTEAFYKNIKNRIDFIDGADLIASENVEQYILNGESRAYGLEVLVKKNKGALTGWLSYTLSRSEQRTPGRNSQEPGINNGRWYNTAFDRTHDISVFGSLELNKKWSLNSNFIYQTGIPTNLPIGQIRQLGVTIPIYGDRNVSRLSDYHRLDISAIYKPNKNTSKLWESEWVFGLYNVYNRRNAASYTFRENRQTGENEAIRTSIFGIVPSISYNFKF